MARIAIVGPGAIGSVMAAWLAETGRHDVKLCARQALAGELEVAWRERVLRSRPKIWSSPAEAQAVEWILVTTKAYDAAGAAAWLPALRAGGAPVAVLQNGVEHRERFAAWVAAADIVPVMVDCPAERDAPLRVRQRGIAKMAVADDARGREFAALFDGTEVAVERTADFRSAVWRKLCVNAAGVLSGILLRPAGVMRDEAIGEIARGIVREVIAVGRAEGAVLDDSLAETVLAGYRAAPPDAINSLHADRAAGRPTEIDARNGVIVRLGRKHGLATPLNAMAVALIEAAGGARRADAASQG